MRLYIYSAHTARVYLMICVWRGCGGCKYPPISMLQFLINRIDAQNISPFAVTVQSLAHPITTTDENINTNAFAHDEFNKIGSNGRPIWYSKCVKRFSTQQNAHEKLFCSFRTFAHTPPRSVRQQPQKQKKCKTKKKTKNTRQVRGRQQIGHH